MFRAPPTPAGPQPLPAAEIEPFMGPHEQVLDRILEAQRAGRIVRTHPIQHLDNGQVLIITELRPELCDNPEPEKANPARTWWSDWHVYLTALGIVVGAVCLGAVLLLIGFGLHAVVVWGIAHAVGVGIGVLITFLMFLMFAAAIAKMRHGPTAQRRY